MSASPPGVPAQPRFLFAYLLLTSAVSGGLVMVVEVTGSRAIGPLFGVSLFVWTSLITVTLVALAAGYAAGGVLADHRGSTDTLYATLLLAGLAALLVPVAKVPVLKACAPLGLRTGALASAALLFGPCLFLFGCVSPLIVKIAAREIGRIGRTVGVISAVSTLGSFAGTLATGFILIGYVGVNGVFALVGGTALLLGAAYFAFVRRTFLPLLGLLLPALLLRHEPLTTKVMANGTTVTEIVRREGYYGTVQVVDYSAGEVHTRELVIDGLVQTGIDLRDGLSVYEFAYFLEYLPYGMRPGGASALVVGLGGGVVPMAYERHGIPTDVVEINPDVVKAARDQFGLRLRGRVHVEDARRFLARPGRRYDYVVFDVFTGDATPSHLLTREALRDLRGHLAPGGIVAMNLAMSLRNHTRTADSVVRTLRLVFPSVRLFPIFDPEAGDGIGNVVVIACDGPGPPFDPGRVAGLPVHALARTDVERYLGREYPFAGDQAAPVLTDDFNPTDVADVWCREQVRRRMIAATDWDILL